MARPMTLCQLFPINRQADLFHLGAQATAGWCMQGTVRGAKDIRGFGR
jgi:hypothetical protein